MRHERLGLLYWYGRCLAGRSGGGSPVRRAISHTTLTKWGSGSFSTGLLDARPAGDRIDGRLWDVGSGSSFKVWRCTADPGRPPPASPSEFLPGKRKSRKQCACVGGQTLLQLPPEIAALFFGEFQPRCPSRRVGSVSGSEDPDAQSCESTEYAHLYQVQSRR